jgi:DNA-directed RNA polymerase subunit H (RpoH/RPB5)
MDSNLEPGIADILLRSRQTILDILEDRGYDTTPYRNIAPEQILALAEGTSRALDIVVKKRSDPTPSGVVAPCDRAYVVYILQDRIRLRVGTFVRDIYVEEGDEDKGPTKADDVIVILNEPYHEVFDKAALQMWQQQKARMTFFHLKQVVVHLGRHVLVPPHRKLTPEEGKAEMAKLHVTQKSQFPLIKHHDIQARLMGLVPGDIVEVLRPSPTAGVSRILRICAA